MSFAKEQEMYPIISEFLESKFRCKTVQDLIRFKILKGWKIDVAGIFKENGVSRLISVEAKNRIGPYAVLQAISQAEMYQKVATLVYIAFPEEKITEMKKRNESDLKQVISLCKSKGIGILSVDQKGCKIIEKPLESLHNIDIYFDLIDQLEERTIKDFEGFDERDFDYFTDQSNGRRGIVLKKIKYLLRSVKQHLLQTCSNFPNIDPRNLQVKIGSFRKSYCWCYVSQVSKPELPYEAHYTIDINNLGVGISLNMETDKSVKKFIQNSLNRRNDFLSLVKAIADEDEEYELKIWERIAPLWDWEDVVSFNIKHIDNSALEYVFSILKKQKHSVIRFVCPKYYRGNEILYNDKIISELVERIEQMDNLYGFVRI